MNETPNTAGLVRCEITGRLVPEDEIVTIQGHRVCAQGKAELLDRLKAGERAPGEFERPTVLRRWGCMCVDGLVFGALYLLVTFGAIGTSAMIAPAGGPAGGLIVVLWQLLYTGLFAAYQILMHGHYGQTLGKMAGKIKVVNHDGTPLTMGTSALRCLYFQGPNLLSALVLLSAAVVDSEGLAVFSGLLSAAGSVYVMISAILAAADREQQRAIHDRLARTRVIMLD